MSSLDLCPNSFYVFSIASGLHATLLRAVNNDNDKMAELNSQWEVLFSAVLGLYGLFRVNATDQTCMLIARQTSSPHCCPSA